MDDEKKKYLYGGSYDDAISDTYQQIQNRPAFSYDVDGDALYQQYKDRYTQNAKLAMKDTMGQAAALTGGYGNSYAQGVGQQRYDETMRGLTDMIPQLEGRAYERWQAEGNALQNRLGMLHNMGAAEQSTKQQTYSQIANLISTTGYQPTEQDLANSGMTAEQANAMLQWWITNNPDAAYQNGQLSPEDYYRLTGRYPAGYNAAGGGGGWVPQSTGGGGWVPQKTGDTPLPDNTDDKEKQKEKQTVTQEYVNQQMKANKASAADISAWLQKEYGYSRETANNMARTAYAVVYGH